MNDKTSEVYEILKKEILSGTFEDGEHLAEAVLAEKYGVNRVHVKSALEQLALEHLVEYKKNRGFFVVGLTKECMDEIGALRKSLTVLIADSILDTVTDDELDELDNIINRTEAFNTAGLDDDAIDESARFYAAFQSYSPYKRVVSILDMYNDYIFAIIRNSVSTKADYDKGVEYLRRFVDALRSRNIEQVKEVVKDQDDYKAVV